MDQFRLDLFAIRKVGNAFHQASIGASLFLVAVENLKTDYLQWRVTILGKGARGKVHPPFDLRFGMQQAKPKIG